MPSTPSIYKRYISLDYKILISPKKEKHRRSETVFSLYPNLKFLKDCQRHSCHKSIHYNKMAHTASHNK